MRCAMRGRKVRIGAIGAGWWATTNHFPLLVNDDRVELVGVSSPGGNHLHAVQKQFGFQHVTEDYRELLEWDLDGVVVATPHHLHHEHAAAALDRGLTVLCEKPMALSAVDAWDMVDRGHRTGGELIVAYGWNYKSFIEEAATLLRSPGVGELEFVSARMASPTKNFFSSPHNSVPRAFGVNSVGPDPATWQDPKHGGGYAHGQLTHLFGILFSLTDLRAEHVLARTSRAASDVDLYDAALIGFTNGAHGVVSGAGTLPDDDKFQIDIQLYGSEGVLLIDLERERVELRRHDGSRERLDIRDGEGDYSCEGPVRRFVDLACGEGGDNLSSGDVGARAVEALEALKTSASGQVPSMSAVDLNLRPARDAAIAHHQGGEHADS